MQPDYPRVSPDALFTALQFIRLHTSTSGLHAGLAVYLCDSAYALTLTELKVYLIY